MRVSEVGLGGNTFGPPRLDFEASKACIRRAGELGINFIDTAAVYGNGCSEDYIGKAITGERNRWVLATKFNFWKMGPSETVASRIRAQCEESLRKLRTDYIDLYQLHMPDPSAPMEHVLDVLGRLVQEGKVRWVGVCNVSSWRHAFALDLAGARGLPRFVSSQNHYNLLRRHVELETLPFCEEQQIGFLPYHPLAGGFLTDKYEQGKPAPPGTRGAAGSPIVTKTRSTRAEAIQTQLKEWSRRHGRQLGELAIAWLLSRYAVSSVIVGVSSPSQVELNAHAAQWALSDSEIDEVEAIAVWDAGDISSEGYLTPRPPRRLDRH